MKVFSNTKTKWLRKGLICFLAITGGLLFQSEAETAYAAKMQTPQSKVLTDAGTTGRNWDLSDVSVSFDQNYASVGTALTVSVEHADPGDSFTYEWRSGDAILTEITGNTYTPTQDDLESMIQVTVTSQKYGESWKISMYCSQLPVVYIDTADGLDVLEKETYKDAHLRLQGNEEFSDSSILYDGVMEIKGRGNSTWDYAASNGLKKPYKLKLDEKADLLGMGKNKHWVLLANLIDHTNMRNQLMYEFSRDIGMECYMDSKQVVVILNGEYLGLYQLCEHKRVDENRIDVFDWEGLGEDIASEISDQEDFSKDQKKDLEEQMTTDFSWYDTGKVTFDGTSYEIADYWSEEIPEFTGGFVFDMDFRLDDPEYISKFRTEYGYPMFFEAPEYAVTSNTMFQYAKNYLQAFENAIHSDDFYASFDGEDFHYSQLFDIDSLVQNWFLVEYSMNWDGMKNSTLMYKDLDGPLKMGPAWDYDWCWGNINMYNNTATYVIKGWHTNEESFCEQPYQRENWNRYLISDPYFVTLLYEKWQEIRQPVIEEMIRDGGKIDTLTEAYRLASEANDEKWSYSYGLYSGYGITNGQPTYKQSEFYEDAVNSMKYFIENRVAWMDKQFTSVEHLLASLGRFQASSDLWVEEITIPETGGADVTARVTDASAAEIAFYVNGIYMGSSPVKNQTAAWHIPQSALRDGSDALNTVQLRALDEDGNFLKNGTKAMTNYKNFQSDWEEPAPPLNGTVTILGKPEVGATLMAMVSDDNNSGQLSYQWLADDEEIPGAVHSTYLVTETNVGKRLRVRVTSNVETGSLLSEPTEMIVRKAPSEKPDPGDGTPPDSDAPSGAGDAEPSGLKSLAFQKSEYLLPKGSRIRLTVLASPSGSGTGALTWSSSSPSIVTVDHSGTIHAKKKGRATITVQSANGKSASVKIIVSQVRLKVKTIRMQKGTSTTLLGIRSKYPATDQVASWKSSNRKVATVNKKGKVTAKKKGSAKITVTMKSGAKASYKLLVTKKPVKTKKLRVPSKKLTLTLRQRKKLNIRRVPLTANDKLTYHTSNPSVVTVNPKGVLRAVGKGRASIRIKCSSGPSITIRVRVRKG